MNTEFEVKEILRGIGTPEERAKRIMKFTIFEKEDIIAAIKIGGEASDIFRNLINLYDKK